MKQTKTYHHHHHSTNSFLATALLLAHSIVVFSLSTTTTTTTKGLPSSSNPSSVASNPIAGERPYDEVAGREEPGPDGSMPIPPEVERVLPPEAVAQIKAILADRTLIPPQPQEKIDKVMMSLPDEVLDRIPKPPGFEQLPADVLTRLKAISRQRHGKSWADKQRELQAYVEKLPFDQQSIVRQGMNLPPPPPNFKRFGPPGVGGGGGPMMPGGGMPMPGGNGGMPPSRPGGGFPMPGGGGMPGAGGMPSPMMPRPGSGRRGGPGGMPPQMPGGFPGGMPGGGGGGGGAGGYPGGYPGGGQPRPGGPPQPMGR